MSCIRWSSLVSRFKPSGAKSGDHEVNKPPELVLPDLEASWKWPRRINPYFAEIDQERTDWAAAFGAYSPAAVKAVEKCRFNLLAGLSYPCLSKDQLRSCCDLINLFFVYDEHSDKVSPEEVWNQGQILLDAFRDCEKPRPEGEWVGGEVARQFWINVIQISTATFRRRFVATWEQYVDGVTNQARLRSKGIVPDLKSYFTLRRTTIGTMPSFAMAEIDMDIPDDIREHPIIRELEVLVTDLVGIVNDLLSYNKEQSLGDDEHNIITVVMKERNLTAQEAVNWAGNLHASLTRKFNKRYQELPRWGGPVDMEVQRLVDGIASWETGNLHWSYESGRYFGGSGLEVKRTRRLPLLPKAKEPEGHIGPLIIEDITSSAAESQSSKA